VTLLLFLYVTEEAGRKYVRDMPWPPAAECNMITNKQTNKRSDLVVQSGANCDNLATVVANCIC